MNLDENCWRLLTAVSERDVDGALVDGALVIDGAFESTSVGTPLAVISEVGAEDKLGDTLGVL
jgi:hypothetical protein